VEHVTGKRCFTTQRRCGKTWRPTRVPQVPLSPFSWMTEERASPPLGQGEKPFDKRAYRFPGGHAKMRRLRHPHCFDRWAGLDGAAFRMPCTCLIGVGRKFAENDVIYAETYRLHSKLFILHENAGYVFCRTWKPNLSVITNASTIFDMGWLLFTFIRCSIWGNIIRSISTYRVIA
jgi:hypothetical protein